MRIQRTAKNPDYQKPRKKSRSERISATFRAGLRQLQKLDPKDLAELTATARKIAEAVTSPVDTSALELIASLPTPPQPCCSGDDHESLLNKVDHTMMVLHGITETAKLAKDLGWDFLYNYCIDTAGDMVRAADSRGGSEPEVK